MIPLEYLIAFAFAIDLLVGDPRSAPHPVKWMGRLAGSLEEPARRLVRTPKMAGMVVVLIVLSATLGAVLSLTAVFKWIHPALADAFGVLLIYWGLAVRDMYEHCSTVAHALESGDPDLARSRVGMICGRDTALLDEAGVARAAVESAAENLVDGVTAPLFFATLGGPAGIMTYKAISTLDSTFGYMNTKYKDFGWASARLDDLAAFAPSRLTGIMIPLAAGIAGLNASGSFRVFRRDRLKSPSPNAGHGEAAFAGALGVRLGGPSVYGGKVSHKPYIGDRAQPIGAHTIRLANRLLLVSSALFLILALLARAGLKISMI